MTNQIHLCPSFRKLVLPTGVEPVTGKLPKLLLFQITSIFMKCQCCGNPLSKGQKKFCSSSCSVRFTNSTRKKPAQNILKTNECKKCGNSIERKNWKDRRRLCSVCAIDLGKKTLGEAKKGNNSRYYGGSLRGHARKSYGKSGFPLSCRVCGYSLHIDICHIKAVSEFPKTALISEINHPTNLVGLCKNHHWEFDNGYLKVEDLLRFELRSSL